jgi:hypothetical protein
LPLCSTGYVEYKSLVLSLTFYLNLEECHLTVDEISNQLYGKWGSYAEYVNDSSYCGPFAYEIIEVAVTMNVAR